jgi:diaminopimelate decarboxylase
MDSVDPTGALVYRAGVLHLDRVPVPDLAARFGTPLYTYSARVLRERYLALENAMRDVAPRLLVCYALKANNNPALGGILAGLGAGADVVSGGELYLALRMGFQPHRVVFAGVGKTAREMAEALDSGIRCFHVESAPELAALERVAASVGKVAPVAVRVNPDVDAGTHPHITTGTRANKFGVEPPLAAALVRRAAESPHLEPVGLDAHVGSQLLRVAPIAESARRLLDLWDALASEGIALRELDIGGGLGIRYRPEDDPEGPEELAAALRPLLAGRDLDLVMEPGRYIAGPAGVLLTTVTYVKTLPGEHVLAVVDAGMNDLLRPALYDAYHPVYPVREEDMGAGSVLDLVGPVCESADVLARGRRLGPVAEGDVLAIGQAGAYGFSMASQYNARPRPAEVLVDGAEVRLIRPRETYADLWAHEPDESVP